MGYELELKVKFQGFRKKWEGIECSIKFEELSDDGSYADAKLFITKEGDKAQGIKLKQEMASEKIINIVHDRIKEVLGIIRDEAV